MHEMLGNSTFEVLAGAVRQKSPLAARSAPVEVKPSPAISELALANLLRRDELSNVPEFYLSRSVVLLLTLRPEVTQVAVLAALCASAANVLNDRIEPEAVRALTRFYPVGTARFILASARYCRSERISPVSQGLDKFHELLSAALNATIAFTSLRTEREDIGAVAASGVPMAWRCACDVAHELLARIDDEIGSLNPLGRADKDDILMQALAEAAEGLAPMRSETGEFTMPKWFEQRRSARIQVSCTGTLTSRFGTSVITISDIATGGIGVATDLPPAEDERVIVTTGRVVLPGTVVWSRHGRAGIALDESLVIGTPTYRFLASHAS